MAEATHEQLSPLDTYNRLAEVYSKMPDHKLPTGFKKRKEMADGSFLAMDKEEQEETIKVGAGFGGHYGGQVLHFEIGQDGLKNLRSTLRILIGKSSLGDRDVNLTFGRSGTDAAKELTDWVSQLAESDTFIQPPLKLELKSSSR